MTTSDLSSGSNVADPCVAVIGVGRSGTSATVGLLVKLGLSGPRGDDLLPATSFNQSGHWESRSVIRCNVKLLRSVGASGHGPPPTTLNWDGVRDYTNRTAEAQRWYKNARSGGPVMVKDPRMCHTLSFWREALPAPMAAVFVLRDPLQVARSLKTRDGLPISLGLSLWDRADAVSRSQFGGSADTRTAVRPDAFGAARRNDENRRIPGPARSPGLPGRGRASGYLVRSGPTTSAVRTRRVHRDGERSASDLLAALLVRGHPSVVGASGVLPRAASLG